MRIRRCIAIPLFVLTLSACTNVFYYPTRQHVITPERLNLAYTDIYFPSYDGTVLHGWFLPAQGTSLGTVLFLHGNAENISTHFASVYWLPQRGYDVFLLDYRGYGQSKGKLSIGPMHRDIESTLEMLLARSDVQGGRIILFGQSLGGAMAIHAAGHSKYRDSIRAVVIESAFSSYREVTREKLDSFFLSRLLKWPLSWTISEEYSPLLSVGHLSPIPLLLIHGDRDQIVPVHHSQTLFEQAQEPKEFWIIPGGRHIAAFRDQEMRNRLIEYLENLDKREDPGD